MSAGKIIIDDGGAGIVSEDVHPLLCRYLNDMLATGLYGRHRADVAVRLIERGVREAIEQRIIEVLE
ncbi:hypothetical protein LCGC14_2492860 [marine sediment metagenome]|uniref:Uncharacterized protein n=1 Tax=marine sediment metagenome TaxID=412755 RepID=A0A0F9DY33_9ZZZZ